MDSTIVSWTGGKFMRFLGNAMVICDPWYRCPVKVGVLMPNGEVQFVRRCNQLEERQMLLLE